MQQTFDYENFDDENGNPAGGWAEATGLRIDWQNGPLAVDGVRLEPSGAFVETVLAVAKSRLEYYQDSKFNSTYNANAIRAIDEALAHLQQRTRDREARGVEGTHTK